jgi:hypothetical protein
VQVCGWLGHTAGNRYLVENTQAGLGPRLTLNLGCRLHVKVVNYQPLTLPSTYFVECTPVAMNLLCSAGEPCYSHSEVSVQAIIMAPHMLKHKYLQLTKLSSLLSSHPSQA